MLQVHFQFCINIIDLHRNSSFYLHNILDPIKNIFF